MEGTELLLKPEPDNIIDHNALAFYYKDASLVGYLPRLDQPFAQLFMAQGCIRIKVTEIGEDFIDSEFVVTQDMLDKDIIEKYHIQINRNESSRGMYRII